MNKQIFFKVLILMMFVFSNMSAQKIEVADFLKTGVDDAKILAEAYLNPFGEMVGRSINGGWYNVASVHSILGIDVNIGLNFAMVSSSGKEFDVNDYLSKMSDGWNLVGNNNMAPTISGKMDTRPTIHNSSTNTNFTLPNGLGLSMAPLPILQAGVGLPFRTEIIGRFCPTLPIAKFSVGLWGIGLKHDIKEYLPIIKHLPILHTSILVGYTKMSMNFDIDYTEIQDNNDRKLSSDISGFTGRLLVGANLPFVSLYMGLGYGNSSSSFDLQGTYQVDGAPMDNPISLKFKNDNFDANIGARLKFGLLTLHGDYTIGQYSTITAGLGVSFR